MNKIKYLLIASLALISISCVKDPWKEINKGEWNHDHSVLSLVLEGQVGETTITNTDLQSGTIELELVPYIIENMAAVKVKSIELSLDAIADIAVGHTLDFTKAEAPSITVASPNGDVRVYTIDMTEFRETLLGCYKISGSMVLGGTGHVYGGAGLMSPESKSWLWDDKGFGPTAEYDNYLEFTLDEFTAEGNTRGTCVQYAGADGKYWNCVLLAKYNKEGLGGVDLHKYYRNIPMGTSTWERNYTEGTISFTDSENKVTVCRLIDSGDHVVLAADGQGKEKVLSVADQAFAFSINGVDDWTNIYGDYDKFAKKAMGHFILVSKVDEIPAASQVEGTEGEINLDPPPVIPAENLAGTYKVAAMHVFTGCDPDKNNIIDIYTKDFSFSSSFPKAKDDLLVLTPTGTDSNGNEVGTADYQSGANGAYWDYVMAALINKVDNTQNFDGSIIYNQIPHGQSTYTYDKTAGTISFATDSKTVTAKYLLSGNSYDYKYGNTTKSFAVANSMAIDFSISSGVEPKADWAYSNYDNMYVSVHNYIISFEKQETAE